MIIFVTDKYALKYIDGELKLIEIHLNLFCSPFLI